MKADQFERISRDAEALAARRPALYRGLLVAMAIGGYAYILLVLLALIGLCGAMVAAVFFTHRLNAVEIKLFVVCAVLIWVLVRALWVRVVPPAGVPLRREELPKLFELIDGVREKVQAPPVERVVLVPDLNASVVQVPLLGLLGWHRNYLTIGLPLLHALDVAQFRAVIAHEFGHLSSSHGKLGVWIYRIHQTWGMVAATFGEQRSVMRFVFKPVINGYLPRFSAFSLAQIRQHEYAADRCARDAAGAEAAAAALVRLRVLGEIEKDAWEPVYRRVRIEKDPPAPMAALQESIAGFRDMARAETWLCRALQEQTEGGNTHPALIDRLAAINGVPVEAVGTGAALAKSAFCGGPSAAEALLEGRLASLTGDVDALWQKQIAAPWTARHEQVLQYRAALADMKAKSERGELKDEEEWTRAILTEEVDGVQAAAPLYEAFLERHPSDHRAMFAAGRAMLDRCESGGLTLVEAALQGAPELRAAAAQVFAQYYYRVGDLASSRKWRLSMQDSSRDLAEMEAERRQLTTADRFDAHDLDPALVNGLRERIAAAGENARAYLVRRRTKYCPEVPCYVLAIRRMVPWWRREDSAANALHERRLIEAVLKDLSVSIDLRVFILRRSRLLDRIARVKGGRIHPP